MLSGATATVESAVTVVQGGQSISELRIANPTGTFTDGERVTANSTTRDVSVGFTVRGIVSDATVVNDGILYSNNEDITVESQLVINLLNCCWSNQTRFSQWC